MFIEFCTLSMLLSLFCNYLYFGTCRSTPAYGYLPYKPTQIKYRKIPKISPMAYIFQRPFLRGLEGLIYTKGSLCFKIG